MRDARKTIDKTINMNIGKVYETDQLPMSLAKIIGRTDIAETDLQIKTPD